MYDYQIIFLACNLSFLDWLNTNYLIKKAIRQTNIVQGNT